MIYLMHKAFNMSSITSNKSLCDVTIAHDNALLPYYSSLTFFYDVIIMVLLQRESFLGKSLCRTFPGI